MISLLESLSQHLKNSIHGNESTRILLFDVDDTLIHTTASIIVRDKRTGEVIKKLSNSEFNTYKPKKTEEFDFGEFNDPKLIDRELPTHYLDVLKKEYNRGTHIGIITARADSKMIWITMLKRGIDIKRDLVFAINDPQFELEGSIQERKAQVIDHLIRAGYKTLVFFDDNEENLKYAKSQERDGVKIVPVHVK